jgi:hypothetical protein
MIEMKDFRIIMIENWPDDMKFFLRIKTKLGWRFAIGADRGAPGQYNYEIENFGNGYAPIKYAIPEIIQERNCPSLAFYNKLRALLIYYMNPKPKGVTVVVDIAEAKRKLEEWQSEPKDLMNLYPNFIPFEPREKELNNKKIKFLLNR